MELKHITHIKSAEGRCWQPGTVETSGGAPDTLELTEGRRQQILGFGGCFNELGWEALLHADPGQREAFLDDLFGPDHCNFNYGRVPIGANDFSLEWYSCDETDGDFELRDFSIARDKQFTLPFVKEAIARQGDSFFLFASPWSPPTWMKTKRAYNFGTMRMEERVLDAYARYFVKFVQAYAAEGVPVRQIHVQNEPMADQKFPSCLWSGEDMRVFIRGHLGPAFRDSGLDTELWLGTVNGPLYDQFINTVLSDETARQYLTGVGLQWAGKYILEHVEAGYPEMRLMQTESECGDGQNSWEYMEYVADLMWQYLRHGAERYTYWNIALSTDGVSTWGWRQNSLCAVDFQTGELIRQPEFYLMKHYSHFVKPGARFVEVKGHWAANCTAFENPDGSLVVVLVNGMDTARAVTIRFAGESFSAEIEPHSLHTFVVTP